MEMERERKRGRWSVRESREKEKLFKRLSGSQITKEK